MKETKYFSTFTFGLGEGVVDRRIKESLGLSPSSQELLPFPNVHNKKRKSFDLVDF